MICFIVMHAESYKLIWYSSVLGCFHKTKCGHLVDCLVQNFTLLPLLYKVQEPNTMLRLIKVILWECKDVNYTSWIAGVALKVNSGVVCKTEYAVIIRVRTPRENHFIFSLLLLHQWPMNWWPIWPILLAVSSEIDNISISTPVILKLWYTHHPWY